MFSRQLCGDVYKRQALSMSGLTTRRFTFEAFLPRDKKERALVLDGLANETRTIIISVSYTHLDVYKRQI